MTVHTCYNRVKWEHSFRCLNSFYLALLDYEYSCENFENEDNVENKEDIKDNEGIKELNQKYSVTSNFVQN